jgi:hypothetical protein
MEGGGGRQVRVLRGELRYAACPTLQQLCGRLKVVSGM